MSGRVGREQAMLQRLAELRICAILAACASLLAGCGGGGGSGSGVLDRGREPDRRRRDRAPPPGVNAAVAVSDPSGRVVASLDRIQPGLRQRPRHFQRERRRRDVRRGDVCGHASSPIPSTYPLRPASPQLNVAYALAPPLRLKFAAVATGLASLTFLASPPGRPDIYVVEQPGRIRKLVNGVAAGTGARHFRARGLGRRTRHAVARVRSAIRRQRQRVRLFHGSPPATLPSNVSRFRRIGGLSPPSGVESTAVRVLTVPHRMFAKPQRGSTAIRQRRHALRRYR